MHSKKMILWGSLLIMITVTACETKEKQPQRPKRVPETARLVGDGDDATWYACNKSIPHHYTCSLFDGQSGTLKIKGQFIQRRLIYNKKKPVYQAFKAERPLNAFLFYDGHSIQLDGGQVLIPHGWLEWPNGKRKAYRYGRIHKPVPIH